MSTAIRDKNKIALSSRNYLLDKKSMKIASIIAKKLIKLKYKIIKTKVEKNNIINNLKKELINRFNIKIEYLEVRNSINLQRDNKLGKKKIFIAYYLNKIRLIDNFNIILKEKGTNT